MKAIPVDRLDVEKGIQIRAGLNQAIVDEYVEAMLAGHTFPPILVFESNAGAPLVIVDGFHRLAAAVKAGAEKIMVEVRQGDRAAALKAALVANAVHGLRRSNRDKKRAIDVAIQEFPNLSARQYAEMCDVSPDLASRVLRGQVSEKDTSTPMTRLGKDGKRYPATPRRKEKPASPDREQDVTPIQPDGPGRDHSGLHVAQPLNPSASENPLTDAFPARILERLPDLAAVLPGWEHYIRTALQNQPDLKPAFRAGLFALLKWFDALPEPNTNTADCVTIETKPIDHPTIA